MKKFLHFASIVFLLTLAFVSRSFAQHPVLFETFTNSWDPCPDGGLRQPFDDAVQSTVQAAGPKIIWLNYHVGNLSDDLAQEDALGGSVDVRLSEQAGLVFTGSVDRVLWQSTNVHMDPTNVGQYSDWSGTINTEYSNSPEASITLNYATIDKSASPSFVLHADLTITANTNIPDSVVIRYAITQDNIPFPQCDAETPTVQNNVVFEITTDNTSGYIVTTGGMNAGDTKHLTWDYTIDTLNTTYQKLSNMKLVAFLEDQGSGDGNYSVVNAAILKQDLDTLQAPPPTLTFIDNFSDSTIFTGSSRTIEFIADNLQYVNIFLSTDNGTSWIPIIDSATPSFGSTGLIPWIVPDTLTKTAKLKLVDVNNSSVTAIEPGTFTIAKPPSLAFDFPPEGYVFQGGSTYNITWSEYGVSADTLKYALANGQGTYTKFTTISVGSASDTTASWIAPDTTRVVQFQLVPIASSGAAATTVTDTIKELPDAVNATPAPAALSITDIHPNPAENGSEMTIDFTQATPKPVTLTVLDILGHELPSYYSVDNASVRLNTTSMEGGTYIVRLSDGTNTVSKQVEVIR